MMGQLRSIAAIAALLCVYGCMSQYTYPATEPVGTTTINWAQNHQIIDVKEGRRVVIYLADEGPEYTWVVAKAGTKGILGRIEQNPCPVGTTKLGHPTTAFCFMAEGPGVSAVRLEKRGRGGEGPAVEDFEITVRVEAY